MFWFVLLLILLGGGFYFYQRMVALEQEIRDEQERDKEQLTNQVAQEAEGPRAPAQEESRSAATRAVEKPAAEVASDPILRLVCAQPGVVQTDLYAKLPQLNKKQAQQLIRELVDAGKLRRERMGSSFRLYLA